MNTERTFSNTHFSAIDKVLAQFVTQQLALDDPSKSRLNDLIRTLSQNLALGHSCSLIENEDDAILLTNLCENTQWISQAGRTPLIYCDNRLYFHRYWVYEIQLAQSILKKLASSSNLATSQAQLDYFFPQADCPTEVDYQRQAVEQSLQQGLSIISGGPGTGKTTTVVKALALMLMQTPDLNIALAAPTGKAAMRLQASIGAGIQLLPCDDNIKAKVPTQVKTLHRLLGSRYHSPNFKHHADNPLMYDVVVVDEASMVDLALMSKLVKALKPHAKLLLLGDKEQLSSVESGSVLADLTQSLPQHTHVLQHSYRFNGAIKLLADAINAQNQQAWSILHSEKSPQSMVDWLPADATEVVNYAFPKTQPYLNKLAQFNGEEAHFSALFAAFQSFQILCSNRQGALGVAQINQQMVQACHPNAHQAWFHGRPVMVQENAAAIGLYNGDIGICLQNETGETKVWFEQADGTLRQFLPSRLPKCETAYAMTIHKSQGSEFDEVLIVLDTAPANRIMTKELVYTAVTRAKKRAVLATDEATFKRAVSQKVQRHGGLQHWLAGNLVL